MKLKIGKPSREVESPLHLWLQEENGSVMLMADKGTGSYYLLTIHSNGRVVSHSCISSSLGLVLDDCGRVVFNK
jgi:hypothetical protein